jgi:hypothetical protein
VGRSHFPMPRWNDLPGGRVKHNDMHRSGQPAGQARVQEATPCGTSSRFSQRGWS